MFLKFTDYMFFFYKKQTFSMGSAWMFLTLSSNSALNVFEVFLKILEIFYSNKVTMRQEIEVVCILFPVELKLFSQEQIFQAYY